MFNKDVSTDAVHMISSTVLCSDAGFKEKPIQTDVLELVFEVFRSDLFHSMN